MFPQLFEAAPDAVIVVDAAGTIVLANKQTEDLFGYEREAVIGKPVEVLIPERFRADHVDHRRGYQENPTVRPMGAGLELYGVRDDGTEFPVEISLSPLQAPRGLLVMAAVRDITERKQAEQEFQALLEGAPDAMILTAPDGRITYANRQVEALFGYAPEEVVDQPVEMLIPERFRQAHPDHRAGYFSDPGTRPMGMGLELFGLRKDGTEFPVEISLAPLETSEGTLAMAAVRDMTDRREAEAEIEAYARRLEQSNEALEQFAHVVSHDLQEPIRMINSYLQLLTRRYEDQLDPEAREFVEFARDGAKRMQALILGLLGYARVEGQGNDFERLDTGSLLETVLDDLSVRIQERGAILEVGELPVVVGDRAQVSQVFANLISNAIKFTPEDRAPHIRIEGEVEGELCRFTVSDNGIGIDPRQADRIFMIFQRLHPRSEYDGQGVGLAICKKIVERHGGTIGVEPRGEGQGTTFWFTLPTAQGSSEQPISERAEVPGSRGDQAQPEA